MVDKDKLNKVKEMAQKGDSASRKFLLDYPEMNDDEANEALAVLTTKGSPINLADMNIALIKDENEAIDGYDKAIKLATAYGDKEAISVYTSIKQDEIRHIQELKALGAIKEG